MADRYSTDNFTVYTDINVRWRDIDAFSHVNNAVYLSYFEEARIAYYSRLDWYRKTLADKNRAILSENGITMTLVKNEIEYRSQAFLGDVLTAGVRVSSIRRSFIETQYCVFNKETEQKIATGTAVQVTVSSETFKPVRVPRELLQQFEKLEQRSLS